MRIMLLAAFSVSVESITVCVEKAELYGNKGFFGTGKGKYGWDSYPMIHFSTGGNYTRKTLLGITTNTPRTADSEDVVASCDGSYGGDHPAVFEDESEPVWSNFCCSTDLSFNKVVVQLWDDEKLFDALLGEVEAVHPVAPARYRGELKVVRGEGTSSLSCAFGCKRDRGTVTFSIFHDRGAEITGATLTANSNLMRSTSQALERAESQPAAGSSTIFVVLALAALVAAFAGLRSVRPATQSPPSMM
jgi:hypothetical protein